MYVLVVECTSIEFIPGDFCYTDVSSSPPALLWALL